MAKAKTKADPIAAILTNRGPIHGDFTDQARVAQRFKNVMRDELKRREERGQEPLSDVQIEALEMDMHKTARIIAGDHDFPDHWDDKQGYTKLAADRLPSRRKK